MLAWREHGSSFQLPAAATTALQELHSSLGYKTVFIPAFQVNGTVLQFSLGFPLWFFCTKVCGLVQS